MKRNIYGEKMFIADLILVSVWALFFSHYCTPGLLLLIPIRIALSFEMYRKSPWTLVSSIGFLLAYSCTDSFNKPFERMIYTFLCIIGKRESMIDIFTQPLEGDMAAWIISISSLWFLWLVILPILVGVRINTLRSIKWKKKWIALFMIFLTVLSVLIMLDEKRVGSYLLGLAVSLLPVLYWCVYNRHRRSPVQLIFHDRKFKWYIFYLVFMLTAITMGLKDFYSFKLIGLVILPVLFYVMLTVSMRLGTVFTRCCVALSISGWLYWQTLDNGKTLSIVMLIISVALIIYVGITMIITSKRYYAAAILMIVVPIVIIPSILGLNPYTVLEADSTCMYSPNYFLRHGVYEVEYLETIGKDASIHFRRKHGLRDRYGLILPMKYDELYALDKPGRYVLTCNYNSGYGYLKSDMRHGVFDLKNRKFVINPDDIDIMEFEMMDYKTFKLINPDRRHFATLYLPGIYRGVFFPEAHIEPHFADDEISVNEFIGRYYNPNELYEGAYGFNVNANELSALRLLVFIGEFGGDNGSPVNDLNFARAIKKLIDTDPYYKGNLEKAFEDVAELREPMVTDPEGIMESYSTILTRITKAKTALAYDELLSDRSHNEWIFREYTAWHNLMEAMEHYIDYLYSFESEQTDLSDKESIISSWYDQRRESLKREREIISGSLIYTPDSTATESFRSDSDFMELFSKFHSYSNPSYYHPMWNEIKVAFDEWIIALNDLIEHLDPHTSLSYQEYSKSIVDNVFSLIEGLDRPGFVPAL